MLGPVLGKGGFCSVRKALHELTGRSVACKIIEKARLKVGVWEGAGGKVGGLGCRARGGRVQVVGWVQRVVLPCMLPRPPTK